VTLRNLDVRDRLPDRVERGLDIAETLVGVVLNIVLFFIGAAVSYGYATGELPLSTAMWLVATFIGVMAVFYVVGRIRGDDDQQVAALVTAGEFLVYGAFGVGIALLPSPANQFVSWVGVALAGLVYIRYDWLTVRLGFEAAEEDVEVAA